MLPRLHLGLLSGGYLPLMRYQLYGWSAACEGSETKKGAIRSLSFISNQISNYKIFILKFRSELRRSWLQQKPN